jgi:hypothetical protein
MQIEMFHMENPTSRGQTFDLQMANFGSPGKPKQEETRRAKWEDVEPDLSKVAHFHSTQFIHFEIVLVLKEDVVLSNFETPFDAE